MSAAPLDVRLSADGAGCRFGVRAQPGARRSGVVGVWNGRLKIAVRAPAQDGRANEELVDVLAAALELPRRAVTIERGERAQLKDLRVGAPLAQVEARLQALLAPPAAPPGPR
jgi:uncharacterized protein (TIGR00251 family)